MIDIPPLVKSGIVKKNEFKTNPKKGLVKSFIP